MNARRQSIHRYREMATDVGWSGISDLLALVVNLLSFILLATTLELETYGGYIGTYGVIAPLNALTWSGLSLLVLQRIIRERDDPQETASRIFAISIVQGIVATAVATMLGAAFISTIPANVILLIAIAELFLFPITQLAASLTQATHGFAPAARIRLLVPIVRLLALLIPYALGILTVRTLALSWVVGFGLLAIASILVVLPRIGLHIGIKKPSRAYATGNIQLALPLAASNLQQNGDKVVMNSAGLEADAGVYGAAFRVIMISQLPIRTMNRALFQRFLPNNENDRGQHLRRSRRFTMASLPLSLFTCLVLFFVAPSLEFLVGKRFNESVTIIRWLLLAVPLLAVSRAPLNGLLGLGRTGVRAAVILAAAAFSLVVYLSLVPALSWRGGVIGTVASELFLSAAGWFLLVRYQRIADRDEQILTTASTQLAGN